MHGIYFTCPSGSAKGNVWKGEASSNKNLKVTRWTLCVTFENGLMRFLYHRWSQLLMAWCFLLVQRQQCWCDSKLLPEPVGSRKKPSVSFVALEILHGSNKTAAIAACFLSQLSSGPEIPPLSWKKAAMTVIVPHTWMWFRWRRFSRWISVILDLKLIHLPSEVIIWFKSSKKTSCIN